MNAGEIMDLEYLKSFLAVAENLSFTKAAQQLFIGQSSVSRHISQLESDFGVCLLIRDNRKVSLTPEGKLLYERGTDIMKRYISIQHELENMARMKRGQLSIVTLPHYFPKTFQLIDQFKRLHPDVEIRYDHQPLQKVLETLDEGSADIGFTFEFSIPKDEAYNTVPIVQETFCVMLYEGHPLLKKDRLSYQDIQNEHIIFLDEAAVKAASCENQWMLNRASAYVNPEDTEQIYMIPLRVKAKEGIAIIPRPVAAGMGVELGVVYRCLADDCARFWVSLVWKEENQNCALAEFLSDCHVPQ